MQVHALRLELEGEQAAVTALQARVSQLASSEQAAVDDAAAVRSTLQAACASVAQQAATLGGGQQQQQHQEQQQQQPLAAGAALPQPAAGQSPANSQGGSLDQDVGTAVGTLVQRIRSLEQQLAMQAAELQRAAAPAVQAVGTQCSPPDRADAAVQSAPADDSGHIAAAATQTHADAAGGAEASAAHGSEAPQPGVSNAGDGYGRADPQQQRVAELTAQLADARLAEVAAKADHAASEARLQDAECKVGSVQWIAGCLRVDPRLVDRIEHLPINSRPCARLTRPLQLAEQQAALAAAEAKLAAAEHGPSCSCLTAEQQRAECSRLQAEVERLSGCVATARRDGEARLAEAAARAQAQKQVRDVARNTPSCRGRKQQTKLDGMNAVLPKELILNRHYCICPSTAGAAVPAGSAGGRQVRAERAALQRLRCSAPPAAGPA